MGPPPDLREFLGAWPFVPDDNVRLVRGGDGRDIMLVRQPLGLEQYEVDGRPDGQRPHGMRSALEFQLGRLAAAKSVDAEEEFRLSAKDCVELFNEGTLYYRRFVHFFRAKEWVRAGRDTARTLQLMALIRHYGEHEEDRIQLEQWRADVSRIHDAARVMVLLRSGQYGEALKLARGALEEDEDLVRAFRDGGALEPEKVVTALFDGVGEFLAHSPTLRPREEPVFVRQGDYWTIRYQGQIARLKATRGLSCLSCLLRNPGREFHVSELVAALFKVPVAAEGQARSASRESDTRLRMVHSQDAGPILDAHAKGDYARRLVELQGELEEAGRFNDFGRATKAQHEMDCIADQLAAAVGLGGRNRRAASQAERARSAVTKRIKHSIDKIAEAMPTLGHHLAARIKTGYYCSYGPHPDRPFEWKVRF